MRVGGVHGSWEGVRDERLEWESLEIREGEMRVGGMGVEREWES